MKKPVYAGCDEARVEVTIADVPLRLQLQTDDLRAFVRFKTTSRFHSTDQSLKVHIYSLNT